MNPIIREVTIGPCRLIQGDCMEVLPTLPKVDAVITDPPYGIGFKYESHKDDADTYPDFLTTRIFAARQLCNPGAFQAWFQAMKNVPRFHEWFPIGWRIYAAAKNFIQLRPCTMQYGYDPVVVWWEAGEQYKSGRGRDFFVADTASVISNLANLEKGHPAPRSLDQMKELVGNFANPAGAVLDPFMGSGTTGVACIQTGRQFIGIEKEPKYFDIAVKRIQRAWDLKCSELPFEQVEPQKQTTLFEEGVEWLT